MHDVSPIRSRIGNRPARLGYNVVDVNITHSPLRHGTCLVYYFCGRQFHGAFGILLFRTSKLAPECASYELDESRGGGSFGTSRSMNRRVFVVDAGIASEDCLEVVQRL